MAHTAITGCVLCHTLGNTLRNAPTWHYEGTVPNICTVFFAIMYHAPHGKIVLHAITGGDTVLSTFISPYLSLPYG